jgi:hypothetical protein
MTQEKQSQEKVNYSIMSSIRCSVCGRPLKKNSELKKHTKCYVCFKLSKGKKSANIYKVVDGMKTNVVIGKRDFVAEQKANIKKYKHFK